MSRKKNNSIVIENGQERDFADSRYVRDEDEREREREIKKLAKDHV